MKPALVIHDKHKTPVPYMLSFGFCSSTHNLFRLVSNGLCLDMWAELNMCGPDKHTRRHQMQRSTAPRTVCTEV